MSTFNILLEIDNIRDESISSLKNLTNSDISNNFDLTKSIFIKKPPDIKNPNQENKTEIFAAVFQWDGSDKNVYITGSFCNWLQFFEMRKFKQENKSEDEISKSYLLLFLPRGTYQYKFKINSIWKCNSNFPTCSDKDGNINNVITIPPNKIEEGTTDFTTSHKTLPKFDEVNNFFCQKIESTFLDDFSYKYFFNYDFLSNQKKKIKNIYLQNKECDIMNGNYSYKRIHQMPNEIINHFTIRKDIVKIDKNNDKEKSLRYGCTFRYYNKTTTFVYYKPK